MQPSALSCRLAQDWGHLCDDAVLASAQAQAQQAAGAGARLAAGASTAGRPPAAGLPGAPARVAEVAPARKVMKKRKLAPPQAVLPAERVRAAQPPPRGTRGSVWSCAAAPVRTLLTSRVPRSARRRCSRWWWSTRRARCSASCRSWSGRLTTTLLCAARRCDTSVWPTLTQRMQGHAEMHVQDSMLHEDATRSHLC